jgi:lipopolysaccharide/colanic/teichoic acid biosynthesis glycosyltransferase
LLEVIADRVKVDDIGDLPVIPFHGTAPAPLQAFAKRLLDLTAALGLLLIFSIPMIGIVLAIWLTSGRPVLFTQKRAGLKGREFTILKFRTMTPDTPRYGDAPTEASDPRVTPIGRFLRKTSLDELPQLFNVLAGQMSMVGPRPEMPHIAAKYQEWQRRRLDVKPGLTGLWQIVGRKNLPLSLNLEYDFYYIKNQSLTLDIVILLRTVPAVIFGRGAF